MLRVLTVCTGNVCRSPLAEVLLASALPADRVEVRSAGMRALVGDPMTPETVELAHKFGGASARVVGHRARLATESVLQEPDLIIGMAREHRHAVVDLMPSRLRATFTLRELARLAREATDAELQEAVSGSDDPVQRLRSALALLASLRGVVEPPVDPAEDDVVDPYLRDAEVYRRAASELVPAVREVARLLSIVATEPHKPAGAGV
ncbi:arsenate reductase/protein-tyrosine-phosphatase family protein [Microbacterium album]|uniref:Low molecular weight phosphatase family protein n=1 Tax=Microbacterium album TaxID=2053191 RepID=A0A917IFT5_9MICO|nr:low molecular weight phosphatase family protein [Microbacterium album]GGH41149.1 low molecular weight phosphatase family protein [Microbacterium album]